MPSGYVGGVAVTTVVVAVVALSIGLAASFAVARRRTASDDPQSWSRLQTQLTPRERRAVATAVRQGRSVDDMRLRPAAVALARSLIDKLDRFQRPSRWRRWFWVLLAITTVLATVGIVVDDQWWRHVVTLVLNVVLAAGLLVSRRLSVGVAAQARAALAANEG